MSRLDAIHAAMAREGMSASLFPKGMVGDDLVPRHIHVNLKSGKSVRIIRDGRKFAIGDMEPVAPDAVVGTVRALDPKIVGPFTGPSYILGYRLTVVDTRHSDFRLGIIKKIRLPGIDQEYLWNVPEDAKKAALEMMRLHGEIEGYGAPVIAMSASAPTGMSYTDPKGSHILVLLERIFPDPWS